MKYGFFSKDLTWSLLVMY